MKKYLAILLKIITIKQLKLFKYEKSIIFFLVSCDAVGGNGG